MKSSPYTTQLQAGLGMIEETRSLLELWNQGMEVPALNQAALQSGRFPAMSARRLRNLVAECFAPRFLCDGAKPAALLKTLGALLTAREFELLLFAFACRASTILADFVREVYWNAYTAGRQTLSNDDAKEFVVSANRDGKTTKPWSATTIRRVASYLTGCCADFGLLERGARSVRKILHYHIEPRTAAILAYDLHFAGYGDIRTDHKALLSIRDLLDKQGTVEGRRLLDTFSDAPFGWSKPTSTSSNWALVAPENRIFSASSRPTPRYSAAVRPPKPPCSTTTPANASGSSASGTPSRLTRSPESRSATRTRSRS